MRLNKNTSQKATNIRKYKLQTKLQAIFMIVILMLPFAMPLPLVAYPEVPMNVKKFDLLAPRESSAAAFVSSLATNFSPLAMFSNLVGEEDNEKTKPANTEINVEELAARVADIRTETKDGLQVKVGEIISLGAISIDKDGETIDGIIPNWKCTDQSIVEIVTETQALAKSEGKAKLVVESGAVTKTLEIEVVADTTNINEKEIQEIEEIEAETHNSAYFFSESPSHTKAEVDVMVSSQNNLGNPYGQRELSSSASAAATGTRERYGSSNFSFDVPLASLSGRGLNASVGLTYNSKLWTKEVDGLLGISKYTFNQNSGWLASGFLIGYGEMTSFSVSGTPNVGYLLTSQDGTKHQLLHKQTSGSCYTFESNDGTFIQATICGLSSSSTITVAYPDGTKVLYGPAATSGKRFPVKITDSNGNMITITYVSGTTIGRISTIRDTLNRIIEFHYEWTGTHYRLIAVTVPGYDGASTRRQTARLYFEDLTLDTAGKFQTPAVITAPATIRTLKYIYFPGTDSGYKYEYSPYFGSIYKIKQLRGMQVSTTSTSTMGSIVSEGVEAASTHYNYPAAPSDLGTPLTDVPTYTWRKDDWLGRTTSSEPQTDFSLTENISSGVGTHTTTIINPDGTKNISVTKVNQGQWDDGLLIETRLESIVNSLPKVWQKTKMFWSNQSSVPGRANPRLEKVETTNDADQTRATTFEYDSYNNQTKITEHDFDDPDELGTELRRTEISYETGSGWINNRLLRLPKEVKTIVDSVVVNKTQYEYDNNGATITSSNMQYREGMSSSVHDPSYNPSSEPYEVCEPECPPQERCCQTFNVYKPETRYRGNVTKVTEFSDATLSTDPDASVTTIKYDILGNVVETSASCCELITTEYSNSNSYTYPVSRTRSGGSLEMTTSATYDLNTGLFRSSTDENNQTSTIDYDPDSLRMIRADGSNGAWTEVEYNDSVFPFHVKKTSSLDATRSVSSWSFTDGAGRSFRSRGQTANGFISSDIEFDIMGRPFKSYNPYTVSSVGDARPGGIKFTEVTEWDGLGRSTETTLADLTTVNAEYNGLVVTTTDQAGKQRRQIVDALGRQIRTDEPNGSGLLGSIGSPTQPTYYEYDGNNNLTKVIQSDGTATQERLFKYDSLSRLTHERQVEANATLNNAGIHVGGSGLWTGVYKYNTDSLLVEAFDANGVKSAFTYDGLHRIKTVTYTGESGYQTPTVTYTYDEARSGFYNENRLTTVQTAANGTYGIPETIQIYNYDKTGQVTKHTQWIGSETYEQEYTYNLAGMQTSQKYPSGRVVETEYDNFGMLVGVEDADETYVNGITLNNQGLLSEITMGNGTKETYNFNDRFQMTSQSLMRGAAVLQRYDYSYGEVDLANGTVDTAKNNGQLSMIEGFIGTNKQWSQRFGYDELGRLSEVREYTQGNNLLLAYKQKFDYDRFGNKYRKAANNPTSGQASPLVFTPIEDSDINRATNRLAASIVYDDAGQVIIDNKFRSIEFGYDANGRQVRASKTSQPDASTVYDASGNRVATKVNDVWRFMVYDTFGKLVAEYGDTTEDTFAGIKYVLSDWQGSVRAITNSNGYVVSRTDYQAFGEQIGAGVSMRHSYSGYQQNQETRQGYGLTETDEGSGQQHTWFRKLETQAGRWSSADPYKGSMELSNPQSFNRFAYVLNDPVNLIDPTGLELMYICEEDEWDPFTLTLKGGGCYYTGLSYGSGTIGFLPYERGGGGGTGGGDGGDGSDAENSQEEQLYCNEEVRKAMSAAWRRSRNGSDNVEAGFIAYTLGGKISTADLPFTNQANQITFRPSHILPKGARMLAIFHTHPTRLSSKPEKGQAPSDENVANRYNIPLYVMHRNGLSSIDPQGNITERIRKNLEWLKKCK